MELVRTPKDMEELYELIEDMRGSQSDLARVAIMAYQLGHAHGRVEIIDNTLAHKETP